MPRPSSRITINDVARLAGVSKKTVSRVINQSPLLSAGTLAKVQAVIEETGFVPNAQARALALRRNFIVALAVGAGRGTAQGVEAEAVDGVLAALAGTPYALALCPLGADLAADLRRFLAQQMPSALVLPPPFAQEASLAAVCESVGVPCAALGPEAGGAGLYGEDRRAMAGAVDWLVAQGHTRIGLVAGPDGSRIAQARELGYLDAMAEHGLDRGAMLVEPGDMDVDSGREAGRLLLSVSPRPTAILACNDDMAAGVLQAAVEAGVAVPRQLSVVGCDDTRLASRTAPPITSIRIGWDALAAQAVHTLLALPDAPTPAPCAQLVLRGSAGPVESTGFDPKSA